MLHIPHNKKFFSTIIQGGFTQYESVLLSQAEHGKNNSTKLFKTDNEW